VDISGKYEVKKNVELYAGVDNIFDKELDTVLGSNVGVYYFTGVKVSF